MVGENLTVSKFEGLCLNCQPTPLFFVYFYFPESTSVPGIQPPARVSPSCDSDYALPLFIYRIVKLFNGLSGLNPLNNLLIRFIFLT